MGSPLDPDFPALLPPGFVDITEADLEPRFVAPFPGSRTRQELVERFRAFTTFLRRLGLTGTMWLNGSFFTEKPHPDDIDLVLLIDDSVLQTLTPAAFDTFQKIVNDRAVTMARYHCDLYFCDPLSDPWKSYWRGWFGFASDQVTPKGIARMAL
jgi:hypothetical protein